jgi:hypothetical protein
MPFDSACFISGYPYFIKKAGCVNGLRIFSFAGDIILAQILRKIHEIHRYCSCSGLALFRL